MGRIRQSVAKMKEKEGDFADQYATAAFSIPLRSYAPHEALAGRPPCCW